MLCSCMADEPPMGGEPPDDRRWWENRGPVNGVSLMDKIGGRLYEGVRGPTHGGNRVCLSKLNIALEVLSAPRLPSPPEEYYFDNDGKVKKYGDGEISSRRRCLGCDKKKSDGECSKGVFVESLVITNHGEYHIWT